jgi:CNT family concentrative nucleoside transporter
MDKLASFFGILALIGIAWLFSESRKNFPLRTVIWGLGLQIGLGILVLGIPAIGVPGVLHFMFEWLNDVFLRLIGFTDFGAKFMFGALVDTQQAWGFIFAFKVLPSIIFFSALVAILYHIGVLQKVVMLLARIMTRTMGTSGAESLSTAGNIFLGQTEAPLLIKPYVATMTRSELFLIMAGGMSNTAGSVLAAYVGLLSTRIPDIAGHLLTMSILSAPASILICKVMVPERERPVTHGKVELTDERIDANMIEAAARGTSEGLQLALNVAAMLIAFIALVAGVNACLEVIGNWVHFSDWAPRLVQPMAGAAIEPLKFSLQWVFGWIFAPVAWLMGIPWHEAAFAGTFLGEKVVLNEFVAYVHLTDVAAQLSTRSVVILSYALCGFANFASIGIMLGGIGLMAPSRRGELARMGIKAVIGGNLASFMTAAVAGLLIK